VGASQQYIVVEGLPGVGKTAFARALAKALPGRVIQDAARENPFFGAYQKDPAAHAFSLQVFSLLTRYKQQQELSQGDLFGGGLVSDYLFDRDRIFANLMLSDPEAVLYEQLFKTLTREPLPRPDLVVYLQASTEVLLRRQTSGLYLAAESLEALGQGYNHYFFHYKATPLLVVNTNDLDLRNESQDLGDLVDRVFQTHAGTQYYTPKK
jgi:deoxyadenosine/deoxycytidine kinase